MEVSEATPLNNHKDEHSSSCKQQKMWFLWSNCMTNLWIYDRFKSSFCKEMDRRSCYLCSNFQTLTRVFCYNFLLSVLILLVVYDSSFCILFHSFPWPMDTIFLNILETHNSLVNLCDKLYSKIWQYRSTCFHPLSKLLNFTYVAYPTSQIPC